MHFPNVTLPLKNFVYLLVTTTKPKIGRRRDLLSVASERTPGSFTKQYPQIAGLRKL